LVIGIAAANEKRIPFLMVASSEIGKSIMEFDAVPAVERRM
jgi:hypothetical protein